VRTEGRNAVSECVDELMRDANYYIFKLKSKENCQK